MKLSVVITAYNEEKNIAACLDSVKNFADEIVVVDNSSIDRTKEIAKKYTKKIFVQENDPTNIDLLKNLGFSKATGDWILSLDADERLTPKLSSEIRKAIDSETGEISGYNIPRKNIIFGKWIEHSLWWPDYQLRLFRKGKGKFVKAKVHQQLEVEGGVVNLTEALVHENYQTITQFLQKMDRYTQNEAEALLSDNVHMHWTDGVRLPLRDFLKTFFLQQGYKDGLHGLVLSTLQAFYNFIVFAKVWEKQGFVPENENNFLGALFYEWKRLQHETYYWFFSEMISQTKNPFKKIKYLLLRKKTARQIEN